MIPLKELQETSLGACGALHTSETQVIAGSLQVAHVHGQVLQPQTRTLSHGGQLGRPVRDGGEKETGNTAGCSAKTSENITDKTPSTGPLQRYPDSLVVCEAKRWEVGIFLRKVCQSVNDSG